MVRILAGTIRLGRAIGSFGAKIWSLGAATTAAQNTTVTNDLSPDGYSWANAQPGQVDKYGMLFAIAQRWNAGTKFHTFVYSNDNGATWHDSTLNEGALVRGAAAYDSVNDLIHAIWYSVGLPGNGILYRRYVFTRDGSHNITDIQSDSTVGTRTNLVMDGDGGTGTTYDHPVLLWCGDAAFGQYGALLATWAAAAAGSEVRASLCVLGATATRGQAAANWAAPVTADTNGIGGEAINVAYSKLYNAASGGVPYFGIARHASGTHANDLFLVVYDGTAYRWRRAAWNSGANNWSTGVSALTTIYNVVRAGSDTGYTNKFQLITAPSEDASGSMYVGLASWKDNVTGDTWGFAKIDSAGTLTTVDVKSWAGSSTTGTPSLYPTGDVMVDGATGLIVASYINQTDARVQLYNPATLAAQGASVQCFNVVSDIPLLIRARVGGTKLGVLERDAVNTPTPPYHGQFATLPWQ